MPFACLGKSAKPWHPKPDACFLAKTTVPSGPGAGGPSLPLLAPGWPFPGWSGAGSSSRLRNENVRYFFFLTPAAADRGAGASAQACCSVGRQTARTKGGGKRFTSQGAPHPAQRTFSPRIVWCPRHEPIYYSVQTVLGSRPLALSRQPSLPLSRRAAPPAPARRECDGISASG